MENRFKEAKIEAELAGGYSKMEVVWHYTDGRPDCGCGVCVCVRGWLTGPSEKSGQAYGISKALSLIPIGMVKFLYMFSFTTGTTGSVRRTKLSK